AYVVYLGGHSHSPELSSVDLEQVTESHHELLGTFVGSKENARSVIFYSYTRHINGFAAYLDEEEAAEISKHPDVISIFLNKRNKLHTTRSWEFMALEKNGETLPASIWQKARFGEDVIIGNLDTGVWPESESFNDKGMGPIPAKWRGSCQNSTKLGVFCNRKLIGAKYFNKGVGGINPPLKYFTARDTNGHGTHTLSTAGGRFVKGANLFGAGNGTAKGGAPNARVAAYKVCWDPPITLESVCDDADILAGFDEAIHDGVDVLSVSLGQFSRDYLNDAVAIGSFHAVMNGITVVCSAGNGGISRSVNNAAPWIITVGASSIDREFSSDVILGNKLRFKGQSLSSNALPRGKLYPLTTAEKVKESNATNDDSRFCMAGTLDPEKVKGKIVVCIQGNITGVQKGKVVSDAGGIGMILVNKDVEYDGVFAEAHVLPTSHITAADGLGLIAYIDSTKSPMAFITPVATQLDTKPAPVVAYFSSRGPNNITPEILKPDIIAPGVNIIAAFSQAIGPSNLPFDERRVLFNSLSGTSMACPHVSGIVGLLKALHPDWSPSAIKSAIMTTARVRGNTKEPILNTLHVKADPFMYGSGHVRPNRAMDPGLVYDLKKDDYLNFLCSVGYNGSLSKFTSENHTCTKSPRLVDFNYPAITLPTLYSSTTVTRTLKNVGSPGTYTVKVIEPHGVSVIVKPKSLKFEKVGEEKTFKVSMKVKQGFIEESVFGGILWSDGAHAVRSPIVVMQGVVNG
ncbi:hypothetical protein GIB67_003318, partial [Kingdonia uniflora]